MIINSKSVRVMGQISIVLMTIGAVDSIRNLPAAALFGNSLILVFTLACLLFLLPCGLVSAELAATWPEQGGVYHWMKLAFGKRLAFFAIWFQWVENIFWYPTILSFIAGTLGYLIYPPLIYSKWFIFSVINVVFWLMTYLNWHGMKLSSFISNLCSIFGLILPMLTIMGLGIAWLWLGKTLQVDLSWHAVTHGFGLDALSSFTAVVLCCCGIEITSVHAREVKNPQHTYPRALIISVMIIWVTMLFGSLAIAIVVPKSQISLIAGVMQAFHMFLSNYHLQWALPLIGLSLIIGSLGGLSSWLLAPCKGLAVSLLDLKGELRADATPKVPKKMLFAQACLISLISCFFVFSSHINNVYWILTVLASQVYMFMYLMMFAAAVILRAKYPQVKRPFAIPGGKFGLMLVASCGTLSCLLTIVVGFIPPSSIKFFTVWQYDVIILCGLLFVVGLPTIILAKYNELDNDDDSSLAYSTGIS